MEFEQIINRLDWLEKERQKDQETITTLKEQIASMETNVSAVSKQVKTLGKQVTDIDTSTSRLNQFEGMFTKQREELKKAIAENEKRTNRQVAEALKQPQVDLEDMSKTVSELKKTLVPDLKKKLKERMDEASRLINNIADLKGRVEEAIKATQDVVQAQKLAEEARKQDIKRTVDMQGEVTSIRKRVDDNREKVTLQTDAIRNMENRVTELLNTELERKQAQTAFFEQQSRAQIERDRAWKDWREKYESFIKDAEGFDTQVQTLEETLRSARKAQDAYLELNTKLERRINEVTEMQRLAEDRLRQEWITFKADDQKRWTGYTLSSEESMRDIRKDVQKMEDRLTALDDLAQVLHDQLQQTTDTTEKQLQELMNVTHEWMSSYERIMGHGKKAKKSK